MGQEQRHFDVQVEEVHSGDDLVLMVNLGVDGLFKRVRARLKGVDTPSAFKVRGDTEAGAVRDTIKELIVRGACSILLHSQGKGGWLVTLFISTDNNSRLNVNDMLIQKGYVYQSKSQESQ